MQATEQRQVLIVDDEEDILYTMAMFLKAEQLHVHTAANGREALDLILSQSFDLVISDILMPEIDGIELLQRIKELDETTQVILMTGHSKRINAPKLAQKYGAIGVLRKPMNDLDDLLDMVDEALSARDDAV